MKNLIFILCFVSAGIFLMPKVSKACSCCHQSTKEMVCNSQQVSNKTANPSCCNIHETNDAYSQQGNSCGGHGTCNCSTNNVSGAITIIGPVLLPAQMKGISQALYSTSPPSSGYFAFWQPPKIF